jgi:ankyrin repeat protein
MPDYSQNYANEGVSEDEIENLFSAARHGRVDEIERLLSMGIPVDVKDAYGNTVLTVACQNGNKRVAKTVLRRGANLNTRNFKGNTPLHYCYHYGYGDTLGQYMISKGADAQAKNNVGHSSWEGI